MEKTKYLVSLECFKRTKQKLNDKKRFKEKLKMTIYDKKTCPKLNRNLGKYIYLHLLPRLHTREFSFLKIREIHFCTAYCYKQKFLKNLNQFMENRTPSPIKVNLL